ncbi:autotransporter domain-containing protein [Candidatus Pelagibacter sp.]|nr:autotransporter domain-containing protein [Candidatus Pelagibacter sp.]
MKPFIKIFFLAIIIYKNLMSILNFIKKLFSIFSIFLIFNLTFVNSAQADPELAGRVEVATGGSDTTSKPQNVVFNADGTRMFVLTARAPNNNDDKVKEFSLDTGFDVTSNMSLITTKVVKTEDTAPRGLAFNNDGTKMFVVGDAGDDINVYNLDPGFDLSSANFSNTNFDVSNQDENPQGIAFNNDGTKMFVVGDDGNDINEYTLSTGFDLTSTVSHVDVFDVSGQDEKPQGIAFNDDGTMMFVVGNDGNDVNKYTLSTGFDLSSTVNFVGVFSVAEETTVPRGLAFNDDGTRMFVTATRSAEVIQYDLDAPFDIGFTDPILSSSVPDDDATGVALNANIVLNFSEKVNVESGNITIKKTSDNSTVETIDVTGSKVTGDGTSQITINPGTDFEENTEYYFLIASTAFDDVDGRSYAGITSTTALSFTIKAMVDPTTDKDVTGSIDAQNMMAKNTLTEFTSLINDRLRYLRKNRINKDFTKNNIKLDFGNAMLTSLAKVIPTSSIHLTNEVLTSLAIAIPTSKTYLTNKMLTSLAKVTPASHIYLTDYIPKNWSSWSEGSVSMTKVGDNKNSSSKDIDVQSLALGFDTKLNNNDLLGFAMQFSQSDTEVGNNGTGINSKNYNLSVYRTRPLNADNFIEGLFGVVLIESDLKRVSGANTLTGSRDGIQIFSSINYAGKLVNKADFNLTPTAQVDLGYTELNGYTETGTDALTYDKQTVESGLASIGLEINDIIKFSNSSLEPFGSFQYGLDFSNSSEAKMNYVSDTSTIYSYTPGINSTHLLTTEMGFNYFLEDHLKLTGIFKRIQGSESQQTNNIRFGFHYISQRETEYAMSLDGSDELTTGLNISKNINGFDIKVGSNYSFMSQIPDYGVNLKISNKF